jgi:hypothetical protein
MTKRTDLSGVAQPATGRAVTQPPGIDTSDLPDSHAGTKLGTLRDAIERARARQKSKHAPLPSTPSGG